RFYETRTWGWRPRLYAYARFAGFNGFTKREPGAGAPGFMLTPASRASTVYETENLGLAPQALCLRPLRGLHRFYETRTWGWRPRLYAYARFAGSVSLRVGSTIVVTRCSRAAAGSPQRPVWTGEVWMT